MRIQQKTRRIKPPWLQAVRPILLGIVLLNPARPLSWAAAPGVFSIRDFGATGDGQALETAAINQAIEACAEAGGGQVRLPPGVYLSGTLQLRSKVALFLDAGAVLIGTTNLAEYRRFQPPAGTPEARFRPQWHRALILADGAEDLAIQGPGVIDGNKVFDPRGEERMRGPHTVLLGNCRNVTIRDIAVRDSANYAFLLEHCQHVEVRNVKVTGGWDGVHFRGWPDRPCRDISIVGCQFFTGDDSIAGRYWDKVLISECIINSSCNGIRLIGPATDLIIHDCLFYGPGLYPHRTSNRSNMLAAVNLQPGAWDATTGNLDNVLISDLTIRDVATPFHFALKPGNSAGRITVARVAASGLYRAAASVESWAESPFTNVVFRDVSLEFVGGGTGEEAARPVKAPGVDARPLPAWGFYARHVDTLTLDRVRVSSLREDLRPVLACEHVNQLNLFGFGFPALPNVAEPLVLRDVGKVSREPNAER